MSWLHKLADSSYHNLPIQTCMSNYTKILSQFTRLGYTENTNFKEGDLKRVLDEICFKNANIREFDPEVADELWFECEKNQDGSVTLINFINIVSKAHGALKENITKCENEILSGQIEPERGRELEEALVQYTTDLKLLTVPFQIPAAPESKVFRDSKQNVERSRVSQGNQSGLEASGLFSGRASGIFADVPSARENSTSLKLTFIITVALFTLELVIMFHKNHFYNALVYISIFAIVLLGYFDKYYMKFVLVNLALSVIFDFLWIILQASPFWNPNPPTHHSTIQTPFLRFMYFFVIILMLAKVLLILLFFRYRNNDENVRKSVSFMSNVFEINGRVKENNPISRILSGQGLLASGFH